MSVKLQSRVLVRLFVGCALTAEFKAHLSQSFAWKEASIMRSISPDAIVETHYQNKNYIGLYLNEEVVTLPTLRQAQQKIREELYIYCPKLVGVDKLPIFVFPQIFVS